jgi:superoxide dismutase, Fe-Mn family
MDITRREMMRHLGVAAGTASLLGLSSCATPAALAAAELPDKVGEYTLPPLPYAYDALEPHLDQATLTLHHTKHHAGYVRGLNGALAKLAQARETGDLSTVPAMTGALAFHASGHVLHAIYWQSMKPGGGGKPSGLLAKLIDRDFGSFEKFSAHFAHVTKSVAGSGWGVLAWEPMGARLMVLGVEKHENITAIGSVPLMVCDVWEHAYYVKYRNNRGGYVDAFLASLVDWGSTSKRLNAVLG